MAHSAGREYRPFFPRRTEPGPHSLLGDCIEPVFYLSLKKLMIFYDCFTNFSEIYFVLISYKEILKNNLHFTPLYIFKIIICLTNLILLNNTDFLTESSYEYNF